MSRTREKKNGHRPALTEAWAVQRQAEFLKEKYRPLEAEVHRLKRLEFLQRSDPWVAQSMFYSAIMSTVALKLYVPPSGITVKSDPYLINYADPTTLNSSLLMESSGAMPLVGRGGTTWHRPEIEFDNAVSQWAHSADAEHWDVLGNETYITTTYRGLTVGAWMNFTTANTTMYIISKRMATTNYTFGLSRNSSGYITAGVSGDGTSTNAVTVTASDAVGNGVWAFVVLRYDPGVTLYLDINGERYTNSTSIPSTLYNGAAELVVSGRDDATTPPVYTLDGKLSNIFMAGSVLTNVNLEYLYSISKAIYSPLWTP